MANANHQVQSRWRPKLKGYFWIGVILTTALLGFYTVGFYNITTYGGNMSGLHRFVGTCAGVMATIFLMFYLGHSMSNLHAFERKQNAADKAYEIAAAKEQKSDAERTYSLEIRGVGLAVDEDQQSTIWKFIRKKNDNFASIFSNKAEDYPDELSRRRITAAINTKAAFRGAASEAVKIWPLPTFALGPPTQRQDFNSISLINSGRNGASLASTLLLWQDADNTTHAQSMIERLFKFVDENPQVPEALIASEDGDITRNGYRLLGTPGLKDYAQVVPTIFESMAALLVSRSDRVDNIRRLATHHGEDNKGKNTDQDKLWYFYWKRSPEFRKVYQDAKRAEGIENPYGPSTMSSAYWHSQLPELWKTLNDRGPGHFQPSPWLPVRWSINQVKAFDAAPVLGYLHRPIKVSMHDENGKPLKPALQAKALQEGWLQALATLPKANQPPVRVFYDSTDNTDGEIALTNALHALNVDGKGLELGNVDEGYNIGRRLGNTGVSSALVQINLATIASYHDGGSSAVVYNGSDGSVTVQMISPPDAERKAKNQQNRGKDPFTYRSPK